MPLHTEHDALQSEVIDTIKREPVLNTARAATFGDESDKGLDSKLSEQ